jgi:transcriptional repressor NrdR
MAGVKRRADCDLGAMRRFFDFSGDFGRFIRFMQCPFCEAEKERLKVIDSRTCEGGKAIRRRRQCLQCGKRFTTYEKIEPNVRLSVVKKDGRRMPWDQKRVYQGLERACFKRPVAEADLQRIVDEVEEEIFKTYDREVPTEAVGRLVMGRIRRVDQVAYVRFASVYKQFKTLEDLVEEAKAVIEARRFEDPSQGELFVDAAHPAGNGDPGGRDLGGNGVETSGETGPASGRRAARRGVKAVKQPAAVVPSQA